MVEASKQSKTSAALFWGGGDHNEAFYARKSARVRTRIHQAHFNGMARTRAFSALFNIFTGQAALMAFSDDFSCLQEQLIKILETAFPAPLRRMLIN